MRMIRPLLLALIFAGIFYYFTTHGRGNGTPVSWIGQPTKVEITEAAGPEGVDPEEQNNVNVYRRNIPAVVNVTSRTVTFDFFYGLVPETGQGSGFVIDKEGHILTNY